MLLGQHDPHRPALLVDHLPVADLVVQLAQGVGAAVVGVDAQLRLLGHLDLGDQAAGGRIPAGELDAGLLADQAAGPVAADQVTGPQPPAVGHLDVDAGVVLREAGHLELAVNRHPQLGHPTGQDPLDLALPQRQHVVVPGREVTDVQAAAGETHHLGLLSLRHKPIGDPALIENLDRARVQTTRTPALQLLARTPLHNPNIHTRQRQLTRQHQPRRTTPSNHHRMLCHVVSPFPSGHRAGLRRRLVCLAFPGLNTERAVAVPSASRSQTAPARILPSRSVGCADSCRRH